MVSRSATHSRSEKFLVEREAIAIFDFRPHGLPSPRSIMVLSSRQRPFLREGGEVELEAIGVHAIK